ncbi:MAG: S24/S26 family peptidase [Bacteroidales bacterium]|jgi:hypothetical protein
MKSISDNDFNLIEDFLSGSLSQEDIKLFKEKLKSDAEFAKEYNFRIKLQEYWNDAEVYQTTKIEVTNYFRNKKKNRRILVSMLSAAAVIILFGTSIKFIPQLRQQYFNNSSISSERNSTTNLLTPLIDKKPEKGNQYMSPPLYNDNDTLFIKRKDDFPKRGTIYLIRIENKEKVFKKVLEPEQDLISIPLIGIKPGEYKWIIEGTIFSGNIIIEDNSQLKK